MALEGFTDQHDVDVGDLHAALDRLAAELAALDKTDKPTAITKLTEFLKTA